MKKKKSKAKRKTFKRKKKLKPFHHLYGAQGCGSVITEAFLRYAKIDYIYTELQWDNRENWDKVIGQYNVLPQVPTLILPNGEVMTETLATAVHANRFRKGLIPGKKLEDKFWRWAVFLVANIYPTFTLRDNASKFVSNRDGQSDLESAMMERRKMLWGAVEKECGKKWFLGDTFSAIDIYLTVMSYWTPGKEWFKKNCPKISAIAKRVERTAPYKTLIKNHIDG